MGILYFGDNLDILREHIKDESIDLIYLDPPFNSKRGYNVFMMTPKGHESTRRSQPLRIRGIGQRDKPSANISSCYINRILMLLR